MKKSKTSVKSAEKPQPTSGNEPPMSHRYPLELVANLAVRLNTNGNFHAAAQQAIALLDACTDELEGRGKDLLESIFPNKRYDMHWDDFVDFVTNCKQPKDIAARKVDFLQFEFRRVKADDLARQEGLSIRRGYGWNVSLNNRPPFIEQVEPPNPAELEQFEDDWKQRMPISAKVADVFQKHYELWRKYEISRQAKEKGKMGGRPKGSKKS